MMIRWLLGIGIVSFWLVMMSLLYKKHFHPEDSELAVVQPEIVMERLLGSTLESSLDVYKGRNIVGQLRLEPRTSHEVEKKLNGTHAWLQTRLELLLSLPNSPETVAVLDNDLGLDASYGIQVNKLRMELGDMRVNFTQQVNKPLELVVRKRGNKIFSLGGTSGTGDESSLGMAEMLAGSFGIDMTKLRQQSESTASQLAISARHGTFEVLGSTFSGFIQKVSFGPGRDFTLYLGESGNVIRLTTNFLDYDFIDQELRPDDILPPKLTPNAMPPTNADE
jgi:hypothetical protein